MLNSRSRACGFDPHGVTALCPLAGHINHRLVLVQPRNGNIVGWDVKNQIKQTNDLSLVFRTHPSINGDIFIANDSFWCVYQIMTLESNVNGIRGSRTPLKSVL